MNKYDRVEKENIQRADKTPGSIFAVVAFVIVFTVVYIFYPQISMFIPFLGRSSKIETGFLSASVSALYQESETVVIGTAEEIGNVTGSFSGGKAYASAPVTVRVTEVLKGSAEDRLTVSQYGGSVLLEPDASGKRKYNVTYSHAASFRKGRSYLLFLDANGEVLEGEYGLFSDAGNGTFTGKDHTVRADDLTAWREALK